MIDPFTARVRAAAVAGWWTVLVAIGFTILMWGVYMHMMHAQPACMLRLCGPNVEWPEIQHLFLRVIIVFRLFVALLILLVIWLSLWARQLKKHPVA